MISRRRFITIAAAAAAGAAFARPEPSLRWRGVAMGADVSIDLGPAQGTNGEAALAAAVDTIRRMERLFSIYDPKSALSRLNRDGEISAEPEFLRLIRLAGKAHALTGGLFDPTLQPLISAKLQRRMPTTAERECIGWNLVDIEGSAVRYRKPGMAMTLNGIAQGFATDRVTEVLASHGFSRTVVNVGEYRVGGRLAAIAVGGSGENTLSVEELSDAAIATSVPDALRFSDHSSHILDPQNPDAPPHWASATVVARTAAMADALSTALVLANGTALAKDLVQGPAATIILEDIAGETIRI